MKWSALFLAFAFGLLAAVGCTPARLRRDSIPVQAADPTPNVRYCVACPDVLAVSFADRPQWDCAAAIDLDGRLPVTDGIRPPVDGATLDDVRAAVASAAGVDASAVRVELADPRAGRIHLHGPVQGKQRTLPYLGPETAAAFLARTGALEPNRADEGAITVVRPNVAGGGPTEVFAVDVSGSGADDVVLRPGDQVYVGETRRSRIARLLPGWVRPGFCRLAGLPPP